MPSRDYTKLPTPACQCWNQEKQLAAELLFLSLIIIRFRLLLCRCCLHLLLLSVLGSDTYRDLIPRYRLKLQISLDFVEDVWRPILLLYEQVMKGLCSQLKDYVFLNQIPRTLIKVWSLLIYSYWYLDDHIISHIHRSLS